MKKKFTQAYGLRTTNNVPSAKHQPVTTRQPVSASMEPGRN